MLALDTTPGDYAFDHLKCLLAGQLDLVMRHRQRLKHFCQRRRRLGRSIHELPHARIQSQRPRRKG